MDAATTPREAIGSASNPAGWGPGLALNSAITTSAPAPSSSTLSSWPRSAQWAAAALLATVLTLLAYHALASSSHGTKATQLVTPDGPIYRLDLNRARPGELMQVPGIGPVLAERIVAHRQANGPFLAVADLHNVSGIGDKTLARIKPWLCVVVDDMPATKKDPSSASAARPSRTNKAAALAGKKINVNKAASEELQRLPGIGPKMAQRILDERGKRLFASVNELRRVKGIGPKTLEKLRPFVTVGTD